jgi:hypothetical protein
MEKLLGSRKSNSIKQQKTPLEIARGSRNTDQFRH